MPVLGEKCLCGCEQYGEMHFVSDVLSFRFRIRSTFIFSNFNAPLYMGFMRTRKLERNHWQRHNDTQHSTALNSHSSRGIMCALCEQTLHTPHILCVHMCVCVEVYNFDGTHTSSDWLRQLQLGHYRETLLANADRVRITSSMSLASLQSRQRVERMAFGIECARACKGMGRLERGLEQTPHARRDRVCTYVHVTRKQTCPYYFANSM